MSFPPEALQPDAQQQQPGFGADPDADAAEDAQEQPLLPDRPALEVDLSVKLSLDERTTLGRRIVREIDRYRAANAQRRDNLMEWRRNAKMDIDATEGPWEGSSAIRAPFTAQSCNQHATRLNSQIIGANPPFAVTARKPEALPLCDAIGEVLASLLEEAKWQQVARDVHRELAIAGNCAVRVQWLHETERRPRIKVDWQPEVTQGLLEAGAHPTDAFIAGAKTDANGQAKVFLGYDEEVVKDGIDLAVVKWEDLVILPASCRDPKHAYGIGERTMERGGDLLKGAKQGKYYQDAVDDLLRKGSDPRPNDWQETDQQAGVGDVDNGEDDLPRHRHYECYELCWKDDLNGDGEEEWYIVTVHYGSESVLRCQYSPYEHGRPYYVPFRYITEANVLWGMSVAEVLATTQDAANALSNDFFDIVDLLRAQAGNFFYDEQAGLDINKFSFEPGKPVKVDDVKGILPMAFAAGLDNALREVQAGLGMLREWSDLLSATSNPTLGRETDGHKTLGEVQLVLSQGMQIFEDYATGVALSWADVWDQVRWDCAQFAEKGMVRYRASASADGALRDTAGQPVDFKQFPAQLLTADVDLEPAGLSQFADAQTRLQRSQMLYQIAMQNPLVAQNPQLIVLFFGMLLHDSRCPDEARVMDMLGQAVQAMQQQQMMQQQMEQAAGLQGLAGPEPDPVADLKNKLGAVQQLQNIMVTAQKLGAGNDVPEKGAKEEAGHALDLIQSLTHGGQAALPAGSRG